MKTKASAPPLGGKRRSKIGAPKVRLEEVALEAGVSAATVSRVLNNASLVTQDLRDKVLKATSKLGYVAHGAARALASRRSRVLGAVVPNLSNTIFSDMIEGLDGLVLVGVTHSKELELLLKSSGIPFVQTWAPARASGHPTIGYDNATAARLLVDHLVGLGHRDIGVVAGLTQHNDRVRARIAGLRTAMRRHRIPLPADRIVQAEYRIAKVREAFRELQRKGELPTALIANNDIVALGLLLEAQAQGIRVPAQLSIVGVGDLEIVTHMRPPLTTVRSPKHTIGAMAADYLLARISGYDFAIPEELPLELVVRGSTAPPRTTRRKDISA